MSHRKDSLASLRQQVDELSRRLAEATAARAGGDAAPPDAELRASEERYRVLFESNPQPILVYSTETLAILAVNEAAALCYGYSYEEFALLTIKDLRLPEDVPAFLESLKSRPGAVTHVAQRRHLKKDGTGFDVEVTAYPLAFEGHKARLAVVSDVTERKRAEDALRESQALLEGAQAVAHVGSWVSGLTDESGLSWSKETHRIFGVEESAFGGRAESFFAMVHPEDLERVRGASQAAILGGERYSIDHRIVRPDGSVRWVHGQADVLRDEAGRPIRMIGTVQDITERKQLEQQLGLSQKLEAVGRLAGGIAHDFNNLLTAILGYSSLLLSRVEEPAVRQKLDEIRKAAESAATLTRQLLAFSRKQVLVATVLDLRAVISQLEPMLQRLIGEDISLTTLLDAGAGAVKADRGQIEQVIVNLAVNARDAMPRGGRLTLEVRNAELDEPYAREHPGTRPGAYVMLAVSDTGIGMDAETRNRVFEPFFTTKELGKGTGLGLATVYGIVKQSGGNIWVYSEQAQGTTFKVYLPRVDDEGLMPPAREGPAALARGSETVLLVEDEDAVRAIATEVLTESGYRVLEARGGAEAVMVARSHAGPIHLLLTDVVMPGMSGSELAGRIVAGRPDTKVLFMSGYTDEAIVRHGVLESGLAFLQKPFGPDALANKVREVLGGSSAVRRGRGAD